MQRSIRTTLTLFSLLLVCLEVCSAQSEIVLHSFNNMDGGWPISTLIYDSTRATFYGSARIGGKSNNGVVFQLHQNGAGDWVEHVLYSFLGINSGDCSGPDYGVTPVRKNGVIAILYGTCDAGGQNNEGAVFELERQPDGTWKEAVIFSFLSVGDGALPLGGVTRDRNGNLFGTTQIGGTGLGGTVYKLTHSKTGWTKTILHNFNAPANPECHLVFDRYGTLYGTTPSDGPSFSGTVFALSPPLPGGTDWTYNLLYTFSGMTGNGDGADPRAGVIIRGKGILYGTTESGGNAGLGTVFRLLPPVPGSNSWTEQQLYRFTSVSDAAGPVGGLTAGKSGVFYGTTSAGGQFFAGTAFQLQRKSGKWSKTTLWTFGGSGDGATPWASMLLQDGILYGTTQGGGAFAEGIVYRIIP